MKSLLTTSLLQTNTNKIKRYHMTNQTVNIYI